MPAMTLRTTLPATLIVSVLTLGQLAHTAAPAGAPTAQNAIQNVPVALAAVSAESEVLQFSCGAFTFPAGGHLQGIQLAPGDAAGRRRVAISHDSQTVAYLVTVDFPAAESQDSSAGRLAFVQQLPSDGQAPPLRHAGGMQISGTILAVGVEDNQAKKRSQIQFWNIADDGRFQQLTHLTIARASDVPKVATAGAVGLLEHGDGHLLAVGNWDCRAIDFYRSNGRPLADPDCRFEHLLKWQADAAATDDWKPDNVRGMYQSVNLIADAAGNLYLLGFDTTPAGQDVVDLFAVDLKQDAAHSLRKVSRKQVSLQGENHFRYAGGAAVRDGKLLILSGERSFNLLGETRLNVLTEASR